MKKFVVFATAVLGIGLLISGDAIAQKSKSKSKEPEKKADTGPALPDLVVLSDKTLTKIDFGGCAKDEALIKGVVAVRNQGKARAPALATSPIVATYIPEMLDMKDEDIDPNSLNLGEILTKEVTAGRGEEKTKRGLNGTRTVYIVVDPYNKIAESNETNNIEKRSLTFKCP